MRLIWMFLVLAVVFLIPFLIWGEWFSELFSREGAVAWLESYGSWAWAAGMVLLTLDIVLPLPSTVIVSALGYVYGTFWGGLIAAVGSFISASLAYGFCRAMGPRAAVWIAGEKGLAEGEAVFRSAGGWIVVLSRWLPLLPEVVSCLAGLSRMPARIFFPAVACGTIPMGFTFAAVGRLGHEQPVAAVVMSLLLPLLLWAVVRLILKRHQELAKRSKDLKSGIRD
jgi:uncharacterized membrane protein YdjX (TVP38/TMEM64 family)